MRPWEPGGAEHCVAVDLGHVIGHEDSGSEPSGTSNWFGMHWKVMVRRA